MKKRYLTLTMVLVLSGIATSAQIKQATKLFENHNYSQAIPYYLKIAHTIGDRDQNQAIIKLAECYRLSNDQLNALKWYEEAVKLHNAEPLTWFYYGEALRCVQNYELAAIAYNKYADLEPKDPRGKAYAGFCSQIEKLTDLPATFEIKNATNLNSERSDFGPAFYGEGIIYTSDRQTDPKENKNYNYATFNNLNLFFARPHYLDEFYQEMNEPKSFSGQFNETRYDGPAVFTRHDSMIFFSRTDKSIEGQVDNYMRSDKLKIYSATKNGTWSEAVPFVLNSDVYTTGQPSLSADGKTIYFISDMPGGFGGTDIYMCKLKNGKWSSPENLGNKVNSFGDEMYPSINGNILYFTSNGWPGFGGLDLFSTTFENKTWSKPENLGTPINSPFDDFSLILDSKGIKG
jgi:tetratricopeptide (TPR) repeat protein